MIRALYRAALGVRGLGCLAEATAPVYRDLALMGLSTTPPSRASCVQPLPIRDQGGTESCTGYAAVQGFRESCLTLHLPCEELSALFPYYVGRAAHGLETVDAGSYLSASLQVFEDFGATPEEVWPFSMLRVNQRPIPRCYTRAYGYHGRRGLHGIAPSDAVSVRRAIASGFTVVGGWTVDRAFQSNSGPTVIEIPREGTTIGSHAFVVDDYDADGTFGILNSYGLLWRKDGRARITEEYLCAAQQLVVMDVRPQVS